MPKSNQLLVFSTNFEQVNLVIFLTLGKFEWSLICHFMKFGQVMILVFTKLGQVIDLVTWENKSASFLSIVKYDINLKKRIKTNFIHDLLSNLLSVKSA